MRASKGLSYCIKREVIKKDFCQAMKSLDIV